jgi:hypothetical protein
MNTLQFTTRVAVLWVAVAVAASGAVLLGLLVPGALEEMLAGEIEGTPLNDALGFQMAVLVVVPLVMAAVTLLASDRVNRSTNLIAGLLYGLVGTYAVVSELMAGEFNGHVLMAAAASLLALLIAGLGAVGLRQPTLKAGAPASEHSRSGEGATV